MSRAARASAAVRQLPPVPVTRLAEPAAGSGGPAHPAGGGHTWSCSRCAGTGARVQPGGSAGPGALRFWVSFWGSGRLHDAACTGLLPRGRLARGMRPRTAGSVCSLMLNGLHRSRTQNGGVIHKREGSSSSAPFGHPSPCSDVITERPLLRVSGCCIFPAPKRADGYRTSHCAFCRCPCRKLHWPAVRDLVVFLLSWSEKYLCGFAHGREKCNQKCHLCQILSYVNEMQINLIAWWIRNEEQRSVL